MSADDRDGQGFLGRWTRRKQQARRQAEIADATPAGPEIRGEAVESGEVAKGGAADAEAPPAQIDPADLPDIDSLTAESDVSPFLQEGVPEALKRKALRRLWGLDPVFANIDGLNDYDLDYTDAATVVENLKTAYRVGRGYVVDEPPSSETGGVSPSTVPDECGEAEPGEDSFEPADDRGAGGTQAPELSDAPPAESPAPHAASAAPPGDDSAARDRSRRAMQRRWGGVAPSGEVNENE
jgi:hypothetical protein